MKDLIYQNRKIVELEGVLKTMEPHEPDLRHHFGGGVYVRELRLPGGVVATGKMHRHESMNILVSGTVRITTDEGVREIEGYGVFSSRPMTKKAVYAVTDCIILNVHPTDKTDLNDIEKELIVPELEVQALLEESA